MPRRRLLGPISVPMTSTETNSNSTKSTGTVKNQLVHATDVYLVNIDSKALCSDIMSIYNNSNMLLRKSRNSLLIAIIV